MDAMKTSVGHDRPFEGLAKIISLREPSPHVRAPFRGARPRESDRRTGRV